MTRIRFKGSPRRTRYLSSLRSPPRNVFNLSRLRLVSTRHGRVVRASGAGTTARVARLRALRDVGLSLAEVRRRYPHELSGGQLQRVAIARALVSRPALLVADEPVSMIDASLRASIVNLLRGLCTRTGVSIVYITHDLATAYSVSDRILIMRLGKVVESGPARTVLDDPQHEYSRLLKSSVLSPEVPSNGAFFHA